MGDSASPLMLRRRLRTELRTARLARHLTQEQVASEMAWSMSKMNRIEQAKTGISVNDVKALLPLYGITARSDELIALAREAKQIPWWRRRYSDVAPAGLLDLIDYEHAASEVRQFETMFIPGILQTEEYASAVLQDFYDAKSGDEREAALVELRTKRRDLLTSDDAPNFTFIMDESILHRLAGSRSIMRQQLEQLADASKLPNVTIQVVPFTAGLYPGIKGSFEAVEFDDAPDENIVYVEEQVGFFVVDDPEQTSAYFESFRRIAEIALSPSDSVSRLLRAANEIG